MLPEKSRLRFRFTSVRLLFSCFDDNLAESKATDLLAFECLKVVAGGTAFWQRSLVKPSDVYLRRNLVLSLNPRIRNLMNMKILWTQTSDVAPDKKGYNVILRVGARSIRVVLESNLFIAVSFSAVVYVGYQSSVKRILLTGFLTFHSLVEFMRSYQSDIASRMFSLLDPVLASGVGEQSSLHDCMSVQPFLNLP
nr:hypothetical protein Iba_chr11bCG2150 [Ipomoea batatas]